MRGLQLSRDSRVNQSNGIRERKIFSVSLYSSTGSLCLSFAIGVFLADWKSQLLRPFDGKCEPAAKTQLPESGVWSNRAPLWTRTRPVRRLIPRFSPRAPDGWVIDRQGDRWKWIFFFFFFLCVCGMMQMIFEYASLAREFRILRMDVQHSWKIWRGKNARKTQFPKIYKISKA